MRIDKQIDESMVFWVIDCCNGPVFSYLEHVHSSFLFWIPSIVICAVYMGVVLVMIWYVTSCSHSSRIIDIFSLAVAAVVRDD